MTRKQAMNIIRVEVAQNGVATKAAMRAYIENRVSFGAFVVACNEGRKIFEQQQKKERV